MRDFSVEIKRALGAAHLRGAEEADVVEELTQHAREHYTELLASGASEEEAYNTALSAILSDDQLPARVRSSVRQRPAAVELGAGNSGWSVLWTDFRFGARLLRRNPGFAAVAILTLGLGIAACTSIFSAVNAVVLRPLPVAQPDRLYMLWEENPEKHWYKETAAPANFLDWKDRVPAFQDVAGYASFVREMTWTGAGAPQVLHSAEVTGNFFSVLGVSPILGRALRGDETWEGTEERSLVLSHRAWVEKFGADRNAIGRSVMLDGEQWRIVGVMPPSLALPRADLDVWVPTRWKAEDRPKQWFRRAHWMRPVARLASGVTPEQANAQLQSVANKLKKEYPETNRVMGAGMTPFHEFLVGDTRTPLFILLGAVGLLVLIACANIANLLLVRAATRIREIAVRTALGARRSRLITQMFMESLLLSLISGIVGLALGWAGTRVLERMQPSGLLRVAHFAMDARVIVFVIGVTLATALIFGIAPALWSARAGGTAALRDGRSGTFARGARRAAGAIVIAEVALALLLAAGGGLLVRSFWRVQAVNPGFFADDVTAVTVRLPERKYDKDEEIAAFYSALTERLRAIRGIESVAATSVLPLTGRGYTSDYIIAGRGSEYGSEVVHRTITSDYMKTMRVPLIRGRAFNDADRIGSTQVVIINDELARREFRGQDAIGQRIVFDRAPDSTSVWYTIVGVIGSEHQDDLTKPPQVEVFHAMAQSNRTGMMFLLRADGGAGRFMRDVRGVVAAMDPDIPLNEVREMRDVRADAVARQRFLMTLLLGFGAIAFVLALVGVYGVTAQVARQRTREIGIRMAFGAQKGDVLALVSRHGASLALAGLSIGLITALLTTRVMRSMLFQVAPTDAATLIIVSVLVALAAMIASILPAWRATRVDPLEVMRAD